jgi:hypothetical protein
MIRSNEANETAPTTYQKDIGKLERRSLRDEQVTVGETTQCPLRVNCGSHADDDVRFASKADVP